MIENENNFCCDFFLVMARLNFCLQRFYLSTFWRFFKKLFQKVFEVWKMPQKLFCLEFNLMSKTFGFQWVIILYGFISQKQNFLDIIDFEEFITKYTRMKVNHFKTFLNVFLNQLHYFKCNGKFLKTIVVDFNRLEWVTFIFWEIC